VDARIVRRSEAEGRGLGAWTMTISEEGATGEKVAEGVGATGAETTGATGTTSTGTERCASGGSTAITTSIGWFGGVMVAGREETGVGGGWFLGLTRRPELSVE